VDVLIILVSLSRLGLVEAPPHPHERAYQGKCRSSRDVSSNFPAQRSGNLSGIQSGALIANGDDHVRAVPLKNARVTFLPGLRIPVHD